MKILVEIENEKHEKFKKSCDNSGTTMSEVIRESIDNWLLNKEDWNRKVKIRSESILSSIEEAGTKTENEKEKEQLRKIYRLFVNLIDIL